MSPALFCFVRRPPLTYPLYRFAFREVLVTTAKRVRIASTVLVRGGVTVCYEMANKRRQLIASLPREPYQEIQGDCTCVGVLGFPTKVLPPIHARRRVRFAISLVRFQYPRVNSDPQVQDIPLVGHPLVFPILRVFEPVTSRAVLSASYAVRVVVPI